MTKNWFYSTLKVYYFLPQFAILLEKQLVEDDLRWGNTWLKKPKKGQEGRVVMRIFSYYQDFETSGKPMPWLKIAGLALIGWIRDNYPEIWYEEKDEIPF